MIFNVGGFENVKGKMPVFTYSSGDSAYKLTDEGKVGATQNWSLEMNANGILTFSKVIKKIDIFILGAGGAGANTGYSTGNAVGGGGYYQTLYGIDVSKNTQYQIIIGVGGDSNGEAGGSSSAFGYSANGGGAATIGKSSYATCEVYGGTGSAGNVYWYSNLSAEKESMGNGYMNVDLIYPFQTGVHEYGGQLLYRGKSGWYDISYPSKIITINYNAGTNGTGASAIQIFGTGATVSGLGDTSAASRSGQGGGSNSISAGNGLVVIRNAR